LVSHGKSGQKAIFNAIKTAKKLVESNFVGEIKERIAEHREVFEKLEAQK